MTKINNLPNYASEYSMVVARYIDGEYWFWGAYNDGSKAEKVAFEIGGEIINNFC